MKKLLFLIFMSALFSCAQPKKREAKTKILEDITQSFANGIWVEVNQGQTKVFDVNDEKYLVDTEKKIMIDPNRRPKTTEGFIFLNGDLSDSTLDRFIVTIADNEAALWKMMTDSSFTLFEGDTLIHISSK
ncbi:MAG: hypothetical protein ACO1PI_10190 [Bacteroidota bacterium]